MSSRKLKKAPHPPPSFKPPPTSELGFIAHSPPSPTQSNFPYSFHTCYQDRAGYRTEARSSASLSRSTSLPSSSPRPGTVLSMNSGTTPLIAHLGPRQERQRQFAVAAAGMPARKLTKPRKHAEVATDQYASLSSSSPTMNPSESTTLLNPALSRRRTSINWNVAWSFSRRRKSETVQPLTTSNIPMGTKKFSFGPEDHDSDVEVDGPLHYRSRSPSPPRRQVFDLDPAQDELPISRPSQLQAQPPSNEVALHPSCPPPRPQPLSQNQLLPPDSDQFGASHLQRRYSAPVSRRWTLAMVMTNPDMDDESFVKQVEAMRRASVFADLDSPPLTGSDDGEEYYYGEASHTSDYYDDEYALSMEDAASSYYHTSTDTPLHVPSVPNFASPPPDLYAPLPFNPPAAENEWSSALHALLITRDLLKTERNYLASLLILLNSSPCAVNASLYPDGSAVSHQPQSPQLPWPHHPPPALMHTYLLSLISTAHTLIARFESDPSVMGAATAFVECEEEVERVFVGWCGVVGGWFVGPRNDAAKRRRLSKPRFPEGKLTPSPSSTKLASSPSPSRRKSFKSLSGHTTPSSSTLRLSGSPPLPDIPPLPSPPVSPATTVVVNNDSAPPRVPRVYPVRPLSIITPIVNSTSTVSKVSGLPMADKRPPMSRILSEECDARPLPPLPNEQYKVPENRDQQGEEKGKESRMQKTISRSNSAVRLLSLVGVGRKRTGLQVNGGEEKSTKPKHTISSSPPKAGPPSRSKSVLLFTSSRSRSDPTAPNTNANDVGSGLKRSMSDYWRKSVLPAFPYSPSSRHKVTHEPSLVLPPLPPLPPLPQVFVSPCVEGHGNRVSNGPNSAATSSGHDTDEGFYSAEGGVPPSRSKPTSPMFPVISPVIGGAGGVVIDARTNKRIYSVRDLAILPVQRVTRYTLLYRDLLNHTPTSSPCRPILERAVEISHRIAQRCDKAQGNAQLLLASRPGQGKARGRS
ncbi:hypothetical protein E1B28_001518 [Marasmius oreades]|uniref:DH domain-containing protein n=1 Tax=Marasmius oreades TaxID=181124 RepID=A0A9P7V3M0_9AGAR|nr:uncharacterized protein E1B28_001518 [Marasmius oreades]KAG7099698.1 hypothetical protein E1B28_001518 [Marasmius oreades]